MPTHYLACDLGADSGRLMLGTLDNGKITLEELHRFPNGPVRVSSALHWNIDGLFERVEGRPEKSRRAPAAHRQHQHRFVGCGLRALRRARPDHDAGVVLPRPAHRVGVENAKASVDWPTIYAETGIQFMALNTIYQIAAEPPARLAGGETVVAHRRRLQLFLLRRGAQRGFTRQHHATLQSADQNVVKKTFCRARFARGLFAPLCPSGTRLGPLKKNLAAETGLPQIEVIAILFARHRRGGRRRSASGENWAYLSSGTWSLMGVEWPRPIINEQGRGLGFTNEIGFGNTVRLLKNIVGLWIVQECRRQWAKEGKKYDFAALEQLAATAPPFVSLINPDDPRFLSPDDMPEKIAEFCRETGQPVPANHAAFMRCIYESLALFYRVVLRRLERLIGRKIERLHIVGGGSQATMLNQFTANALKIPVLAGPTECTATGNLLIQAIALGHLPSHAAAREVVRRSFELKTITPQSAAEWDAAAARFEKLLS